MDMTATLRKHRYAFDANERTAEIEAQLASGEHPRILAAFSTVHRRETSISVEDRARDIAHCQRLEAIYRAGGCDAGSLSTLGQRGTFIDTLDGVDRNAWINNGYRYLQLRESVFVGYMMRKR